MDPSVKRNADSYADETQHPGEAYRRKLPDGRYLIVSPILYGARLGITAPNAPLAGYNDVW